MAHIPNDDAKVRGKKNVGIGKLTVITSNDNPFFFLTLLSTDSIVEHY